MPTYGAFEYARRCVETFYRYTPDVHAHAVVIDDASPGWDAGDRPGRAAMPSLTGPCAPAVSTVRFADRGGLTRSWNAGLGLAGRHEVGYAVCGNSDLVFTEGWYEPLREAIALGFDLVGPVTNAPGHAGWQDVGRYTPFRPSDEQGYLDGCAGALRRLGRPPVEAAYVNGFCMLARTDRWRDGAYDARSVFDPRYILTGNEDELQRRWKAMGFKMGYAPRSFVFHYRSVSRPEVLGRKASRGAYRPGPTGSRPGTGPRPGA